MSTKKLQIIDGILKYEPATTTADGLMSSEDKLKLDGIATGANKTIVDSALSSTSANPVQNKVVNTAISNLSTLVGDTPVATQIDTAITSQKGATGGIAELDSNGKVPAAQLPSYVDDVLEYTARSNFPSTGETGKIYVDTETNLTYRWSGSDYVEISPSLALGTTSSTAFRGDYGNTAYTHATAKGSAFASGLYKITTNAQGHVTAATAVEKSDITGLGIPAQDTTYNAATTNTAGLMSVSDKTKLDAITDSADSVSFSASATSGNKVGTITINGTATNMYSPTQTSISGNAGSATVLANTRYIDGVSFTGAANVTRYATCSTAAATAAKTASITTGTFSLIAGARVTVKFTDSNNAASPTLNIGSTGAKEIYWHGAALTSSQYWQAGAVLDFVYDGTNWEVLGIHNVGGLGTGSNGEIFNDYSNNIASNSNSHAEGSHTTASNSQAHAEGYGTTASGYCAHAEGYEATASGYVSHAEGYKTKATEDYSHAEGGSTTASQDYAHAEGYQTEASGYYAHAEGYWAKATQNAAHAEGYYTNATGSYSHAEGSYATASGSNSHAEGYGTKASSGNAHVQGKYNVDDTSSTYAHIVGNGSGDTSRSNAHTIDWNGVGWFAGGVKVGGTGQDDAAAKSVVTTINVTDDDAGNVTITWG